VGLVTGMVFEVTLLVLILLAEIESWLFCIVFNILKSRSSYSCYNMFNYKEIFSVSGFWEGVVGEAQAVAGS
jgi:hypothetical protein